MKKVLRTLNEMHREATESLLEEDNVTNQRDRYNNYFGAITFAITTGMLDYSVGFDMMTDATAEISNVKDKVVCCLCGEVIKLSESNNAHPVKRGRCCDACNVQKVIPARIRAIQKEKGGAVNV